MHSKISFRICSLLLLMIPFAAKAQSTGGIDDGYGVVCRAITVDADADSGVVYAANQLQQFLQRADLHLPVEKYNKRRHKKGSIHIARTDLMPSDSYSMLGDGHRMLLAGSGEKGTLYAVYDFLEHFCGFRLYAPDALYVPHIGELQIPVANITERPAFEYREVAYCFPNHSSLYADWHRVHTSADRDSRWGLFVHTFKDLVPAAQHFDTHPEWFSSRDGQRVRDGQLCLSNPQVLEALCKALEKAIADDAGNHRFWSVSPNDNYNVCQCAACLRMDSLYGGPTGTLLQFVNQVARKFPDKMISTLAYQYTRSVPADLRVRPDSNVVVMLCPIEAGRQEALSTNLDEYAFRSDIENWQQIADNIFLWDYVVQFRNFWNPFPNLHVLQPNLLFFHNYGANQMFEQATGADNITSWMEPRCYLVAKLMWNPRLDADSLLADFCQGYYGNAGVFVKTIIDSMTAALVASGQRLDIYGYSIDGVRGYLSPDNLARYRNWMRQAYAATDDSAVLRRLRFFELSLDYATVELASSGYISELFPQGTMSEKVEQLKAMLDRMTGDLKSFGVSQMMEMGISPEQYRDMITRYLEKTYSYGPAYRRKVQLRYAPSKPYLCNGARTLTDGVGGILDYRHSWLGFFGDTLDAVVTLGPEPVEIGKVSTDFYFYPLSWIFLPQQIDFYLSDDGVNWQLVGRHRPDNPQILATPMVKTFEARMPSGTRARFVRVVAAPLPQVPDWHRAAGNKVWIFTDEIVVEPPSHNSATQQAATASHRRIVADGLPPFLVKGDTVALVSPSYYCDIDKVSAAADILRQWGLVPLTGPNVGSIANIQYAGTDKQRMDDLKWAYTNPGVKAIICNRGGYGSIHFVDELDYSIIADNPKWLVGYSDVTTLHSIATTMGIASVHGIMACGIADSEGGGISVSLLKELLFGTLPRYRTPHHPYNCCGTGHGTLVGGNLCTLAALAGSDCDATDQDDFILFIEEVGEDFHHIDRLFNMFVKRGAMKHCRGVILGDFTDCRAELGYGSVEEMLHNYLKDYDIPVLCGFPAGHGDTNLPLLLGTRATLSVTPIGGTVTFDADTARRDVDTAKAKK